MAFQTQGWSCRDINKRVEKYLFGTNEEMDTSDALLRYG